MKILSYLLALLLTTAAPAFATVTVTSPASGATVNSPVQYVATATTSTCAKGVASMGIYVNNKLTYVVNGASLNTSLTLNPGPYNTVVEEWDKCGGASYTAVPITVANQSTQTAVTVTSPVANSTVSSPVNYVASATTGTCAKGVASMGIYVNNKIVYTVNAPQLNTLVNLAPGPEHTVVQEWDFCGGSAFTTINLTVQGGTTVSMTATPASITVWRLIHAERDCDECRPGDDLRNRRQQLQFAGQRWYASCQPGRHNNVHRDRDRSIGERDGDCDRLSGAGGQHAVHQPCDLHAAGEP